MKSNTKLTGIFTVSDDNLMKRGWQMGPDEAPLIIQADCWDHASAIIGNSTVVMDQGIFHELRSINALPAGKIILFGINQAEWDKYYAKEIVQMTCCPVIQELEKVIDGQPSEIFVLSYEKSTVEQFCPILDEVQLLHVAVTLEASKDWYGFPKFDDEVWDKQSAIPISSSKQNITISGWHRSQQWKDEMIELQKYFDNLWDIQIDERDGTKKNRYIKMNLKNGLGKFALVQRLLGKRFTEIYSVYEKSIPTEYLEYAPQSTPKLSGLDQQQKVFTSIVECWLTHAFQTNTVDKDIFDICAVHVFRAQHAADMLYGDMRKDLSVEEMTDVFRQTFTSLGATVEQNESVTA